jgi:hypothetical protein
MKKIAGIIFSLCFVLVGKAQTPDVWDGTSDTTWYNTTDTLFQLTTAEQLARLAVMVNNGNSFQGKTIELMNDVDIGGALDTPLNWMLIGKYYYEMDSVFYIVFSGVFAGNNHTISNVCMGEHGSIANGFFACIDSAFIKDVRIENLTFANIEGNVLSCLVAYSQNSSIVNCKAISSISFATQKINYFGGIVCFSSKTYINDCSFSGSIQGDSISILGGIVGFLNESSLTNSYVVANLKGLSDIGGLIGYMFNSTVSNSFYSGNIYDAHEGRTGGLVGECYYSRIDNCFALSSIYSILEPLMSDDGYYYINQQYGGLIGGFRDVSSMYNCYIIGGIVIGYSYVGGLVGINDNYIYNSYSAIYTEGVIDVGSMIGKDYGAQTLQSFTDVLLSTHNPIGNNINNNKLPDQLFTEEMTSGLAFGLLNNTGNYPSQWVYEEGLYPQLDVFVNHPDTIFRQASLLSVIPIFLGEQSANQIRNDFKVSTLYGVSWTSSAEDIIRIEGENAIVTRIDQDTMIVLTVTLNDLQKEFYVKVKQGNDIKEVHTNKINLYPNPSNYQFTLDNGQELMKEVFLYDVMGRKVQHLPVNAPSTTVDVSDLPNGMYVVKIITDEGIMIRKMQKHK